MDTSGFTQTLQDLTNLVDGQVASTVEQASSNGVNNDRASLKRQLQSLKSSIINLGQKCAFEEAIQQYSASVNLKAEADKAAVAVENAEDELKEWKKQNKQDEVQLRQGLASILDYHTEFKAVVQRVQNKLDNLSRQQAQLQQAKQDHEAETATAPVGQTGAVLAVEASLAAELEAQLAQARDMRHHLDQSLKEEQAQAALLQAQVQELQAAQQGDAQLEMHAAKIQEAIVMVGNLTGVQEITFKGNEATVLLKESMATLSIQLRPRSFAVESAELDPAVVDVSEAVEAAQAFDFGLPVLVQAVIQLLQQPISN